MSDYACHPAAILSDGAYPVLAKFSDAPDGAHQFEAKRAGLSLLSGLAGILRPTPIGIAPAGGGCILVMEAVQPVPRTPHHWRHIGRTLARIHAVKGNQFAFRTGGYFGALPQDSTPSDDWGTFYVERRLVPALRLALESGHLPPEVARRVDRLIAHFPELCGP
jgi:fructosamine-3-kinase